MEKEKLDREKLVLLWVRYRGNKGTAKQCAKVKIDAETLARMLRERGVTI
jgi:hypothetical protein